MKTILITGINGFLGSNLAKALSPQFNIVGLEYTLDNLYRINECNYKVYSSRDGIKEEIFTEQTIDLIIHAATFYGKNDEDFNKMFAANLKSPFDLLDKAIKHNCKLFINTDTVLDHFVSTYALTKRQFQEWLYMRRKEIRVINMQLEHFYGPGAGSTNFITNMMDKLKNHYPQIDLTSGEQHRDFIYIDDVVNAYLIVIAKQEQFTEHYSSFQVSSNECLTIMELLVMMKTITGSRSILNFGAIPYRENELMNSFSDNSQLALLGWSPQVKISEGLLKTYTLN